MRSQTRCLLIVVPVPWEPQFFGQRIEIQRSSVYSTAQITYSALLHAVHAHSIRPWEYSSLVKVMTTAYERLQRLLGSDGSRSGILSGESETFDRD
jgi:hypothetical protein